MTNSKWTLNSLTLLTLATIVLFSAGCTPWQLAKSTLFTELNEYPRVTDGRLAKRQYTKWAREEWQQFANSSAQPLSSDYASGFIYGFTHFVYTGGRTDPPPIPPRKYWRVGYKNPRGHQAIQDWYNGYSRGASTAREKGYRDRTVVPSSLVLGYNAPVKANWEDEQHSDAKQKSSPGLLNEPTLANPQEKSKLTNPFVDDPEPLPEVLPSPESDVPQLENEDDGTGDATIQPPEPTQPEVEAFPDDEFPDSDSESSSAPDTNRDGNRTSDEIPSDEIPLQPDSPDQSPPTDVVPELESESVPETDAEDPDNVFDDLDVDDEFPELEDSAFSPATPVQPVQPFDMRGTPPPPPWIAARTEPIPPPTMDDETIPVVNDVPLPPESGEMEIADFPIPAQTFASFDEQIQVDSRIQAVGNDSFSDGVDRKTDRNSDDAEIGTWQPR